MAGRAAGDITLYAQWAEADRYIVTYKNTKGADNASPTSYRESEGATLSDLTATGYLFDGWFDSADASGNGSGTKLGSWAANEKAGDRTLWAKWSPRTDTAYKAEHYKENADEDGYTLAEAEPLAGTTDARTAVAAKSYENFTAQTVAQGTISADGSTVVKIYYKRNIVTMAFSLDGGLLGGESGTVASTGIRCLWAIRRARATVLRAGTRLAAGFRACMKKAQPTPRCGLR